MTENKAIDFLEDEISGLKEQRDGVLGDVAAHVFQEINGKERIATFRTIIGLITELKQYRGIGTVGECRKAVEKQKLKKPVKDKYNHNCCPNCGWIVSGEGGYGEEFCPHCENCGQAIRWENLGEMEDERD